MDAGDEFLSQWYEYIKANFMREGDCKSRDKVGHTNIM